jgi:hypothetical protein
MKKHKIDEKDENVTPEKNSLRKRQVTEDNC